MKWLQAAALAPLLLSVTAAPEVLAACVNAKCSDTTAIESARRMIQATCGCTRVGETHGNYEKCVKSTLKTPDLATLIPEKACRKLVMKCESASICRKPNAAVCCVLKKNGKVKSSIVGKTVKCKKGSACGASLGFFSQFDACASDGTCAGPPTTTTTTGPATTSTVASTTSTMAVRTTTPTSSTTSTTVRPLAAVTCGQLPSGIPCTPAELAETTSNATCTTGFAMTDFSTDGAGNRTVYKRCVDNELCSLEWFDHTSGKPACTGGFDPTAPNVVCHWCCIQDACNVGIKPADATLANCTVAGVCTPG